MKKLLFTAVLALALTGCRKTDEFAFASWNIGHYALGTDNASLLSEAEAAEKAAAYNAFLDRVGADIVGIAEFSANFTSNGTTAATSAVFGRYGQCVIGPSHSYQWNAQFWNGFDFVSTKTVEYPQHDQGVYYVATRLLVAGREIVFAETHLDWSSAKARKSQMQKLVDDFRDEPCVVIAGDFNIGVREKGKKTIDNPSEYKIFADAGYALGNDGRYKTFPAGKLDRPDASYALDNIIVKGLDILEFRVFDSPELSDHALVRARLKVRK